MKHVLDGLRVVELAGIGPSPHAAMQLADLGAEVIKIENPREGGDVSRATGPYMLGSDPARPDSQFFQSFNRNKKSVTLDLRSDRGRAVFRRLAAGCDAVMNNLRGDQPARLGLTYEALRDVRPSIVCVHLSAYGRDNERAGWPGYDYLMQSEAGFLHLTGDPDGPPARMGLSVVDFMTGTTTAMALLAGVLGANRTGQGRDVDVSLFDVALAQLTYPATWYLNAGHVIERLPRSAHPSTVPCQLVRSADGWMFVMCMTPKFWTALATIGGREDLLTDSRFATVDARRDHREALGEELDRMFGQATSAEWMARLAGRVPVAPVLGLAQALDNPYVASVGMVQTVPHREAADLRLLASPVRLDGKRPPARVCSDLGADTGALLAEAGYSAHEVQAMRAEGVI
jgi:crotonobetainyl-CoA:carnitine CoA-transferase CaiB-like acyl-CoA transferase